MRLSQAQRQVVDRWMQLSDSAQEGDVEIQFIFPLFEALGFTGQRVKKGPFINLSKTPGLIPDALFYKDPGEPPVLVVEVKKRDPKLANASEQGFAETCQQNKFYKEAVGYVSNGVQQYLDKGLVKPECLASYGLAISGDFFQLWRRVDGLVLPFSPVQKVTKTSLPSLIKQLAYCLQNPQTALVGAVWNQKGGVAKTTNIINMGATLALGGKRVLLIDFDPQGDLTRGLGLSVDQLPDYLDLCAEKLQLSDVDAAKAILDTVIQSRTFPTSDKKSLTLSVLSTKPSSLKAFRDRTDVDSTSAFKKLISVLQADYDYIFIDISPTPDKLTQGMLFACDTVLIPSDLGNKSLHHAVQLYSQTVPKMREVRAKKDRLHFGPWNLGVIFSNCPADAGVTLEECIKQELQRRNFTGRQCGTRLKTYAQAKVAEFKHAPVVCWQNSPITKLYADLVDELFLNHNFVDH